MNDQDEVRWIAGFWRRIGAFLIDSIILGIVGLGLGLIFEMQFVQLGGWGRLVGFIIALLYFGILNSKISGGQTFGKKLAGIRVVSSGNQTIEVWRSFARYSILGIPFFLNGARFTTDAMTSFWIYSLAFVIFGGLLSTAYLYVFNRTTRQMLHDLLVGTYVVNADSMEHHTGAVWRPHLIVVGILFLASGIAPAFTMKLAVREPFRDMLSVMAALSSHPAVSHVAVSSGTATKSFFGENTQSSTFITVRVSLDHDSVSDAELARELAIMLADNHSHLDQIDTVQIVLIYGYDIGIASKWISQLHSYRPDELRNED